MIFTRLTNKINLRMKNKFKISNLLLVHHAFGRTKSQSKWPICWNLLVCNIMYVVRCVFIYKYNSPIFISIAMRSTCKRNRLWRMASTQKSYDDETRIWGKLKYYRFFIYTVKVSFYFLRLQAKMNEHHHSNLQKGISIWIFEWLSNNWFQKLV